MMMRLLAKFLPGKNFNGSPSCENFNSRSQVSSQSENPFNFMNKWPKFLNPFLFRCQKASPVCVGVFGRLINET